jgi:hypothetical protein
MSLRILSGIALGQRGFDHAGALMGQLMAHLPALNNPDASSGEILVAVFVHLGSGNLGAAARPARWLGRPQSV